MFSLASHKLPLFPPSAFTSMTSSQKLSNSLKLYQTVSNSYLSQKLRQQMYGLEYIDWGHQMNKRKKKKKTLEAWFNKKYF